MNRIANNNITETGKMYNVLQLIRENGGNIINTQITYGNGLSDRIKSHSFWNNQTNKMIILIKEIAWQNTNIIIKISNYNENKNVNALRIYWDTNKSKLIYGYTSVNLMNNIQLLGGEMIVIYDLEYQMSNDVNIYNICRLRYYPRNFKIEPLNRNVNSNIYIESSASNNDVVKGILRVGMSFNTSITQNVNTLKPTQVKLDDNLLTLSLERIDNLIQGNDTFEWIAFEYEMNNFTNIVNSNHKVALEYANDIQDAYVTSTIVELYTKC